MTANRLIRKAHFRGPAPSRRTTQTPWDIMKVICKGDKRFEMLIEAVDAAEPRRSVPQ